LIQRIDACLREVRDLNSREAQDEESVQNGSQDPADSEDEGMFPMPEEPQESSSPRFDSETPLETSLKIQRILKFRSEQIEWETRPRPEWWSEAWEMLAESRKADGTRIPVGSPKKFKECIQDDVFAVDALVLQLQQEEESGAIIDASVNPELINVATAVVWNEHGSTMVRRCDRGQDINDLTLSIFKDVVSCTPDGRCLTYATHSEWLIGQWQGMVGWKAAGYVGLDRDACAYQWKGIMEGCETRLANVTLVRVGDADILDSIKNAGEKYGHEGPGWYGRLLETPDGAEYPPAAPVV
jgi:hypothetical protein